MCGSTRLLRNNRFAGRMTLSVKSLCVRATLADWLESDSDWVRCDTPRLRWTFLPESVSIMDTVESNSLELLLMVRRLRLEVKLQAWLAIIGPLFARAVRTPTSQCLEHKAGPCWNGCVLCGTVSHGRSSKYVDFVLVGDSVHSIHLDKWFYQSEELFVVEPPLAKCFGGLASFKTLAGVLIDNPIQHRRPNLVGDDVVHCFIYLGTDSPLNSTGGCTEELLNGFFRQVWDCHRGVFDLQAVLIRNHLLQHASKGVIFLS